MQTTDLRCYCFFKQVCEKILQRSAKLATQINCISEKVLVLQLFVRLFLNWTVDMDFILGTTIQYNWLFSSFILYFSLWNLTNTCITIFKIIYDDNSLRLHYTMRNTTVASKPTSPNFSATDEYYQDLKLIDYLQTF